MTFTYVYRDSSGARKSAVLEANSRNDAFALLKAQGIAPMSLQEGGTLTAANGARASDGRKKLPIIVIGGLVCLGGLVWLLWPHTQNVPADGEVKHKDKVVKQPAQKPGQKPQATNAEPAKVETKVVAEKPVQEKLTNRVEKLPDGREIRINEKGEKVLCVNPVDPNAPVPEPIFKHEVESALAMYVKPAVEMPPPPKDYTDEEVRQALAEPVVIDMDKDDEDLIYQKKTVQAFKDELKQFLDEGGTFAAYLRQLQKRQESEAMQMRESRKMIEKYLDENKPAEAKELFDALNKHLGEKGIPPIKMTPKYRGRLPGVDDLKR